MGHIRDRWLVPGPDGQKVRTDRYGKGKRYRVKYQVDGRERDGGGFDRIVDAGRRLVQLEADLLRGQWVDPNDRTTVAAYARTRAAIRPHSEGTRRRIESMIRVHVEGTALGGRRLAAVRPSEAQAWVTERSQGLAASTLRLLVGMMRSTYHDAVADRLVASNPFTRVTLPSAEHGRIVPLSVAQVRALADAMPARYRALVLTQAGLGLRISELLGLRVCDVDFLRRTVRIEHQVAEKTRALVPPKTPTSRRVLPLPQLAANALAEHLREFPAGPALGCDCPPKVTCSRSASALLFHTDRGRPYAAEQYGTRAFARAVERAGLPTGTTTHDLRHHYASVLLAAGESVVAVAERLGHQNAGLVLSTYGHLMADREDHTRQAVDAAYDAVTEAPRETTTAQGRPQ